MRQSILLQLFLWSGTKLFPKLYFYSPDDDVQTVMFSFSEDHINKLIALIDEEESK